MHHSTWEGFNFPHPTLQYHTLQYHSRPLHPFTSSLCSFILTLSSALSSLLLLPQVDKKKVHFHCHSLAVPWAPQGGESENKQKPEYRTQVAVDKHDPAHVPSVSSWNHQQRRWTQNYSGSCLRSGSSCNFPFHFNEDLLWAHHRRGSRLAFNLLFHLYFMSTTP